eukprot:GEMP01072131.1.p1 GENE.GEMP01072131.1~~GEMP01072131.1.p1  ORF type:complete len:169 (+),score=21.02 GEMP01072131.1:43-507(+)
MIWKILLTLFTLVLGELSDGYHPISLTLVYEADCPYCRGFMYDQLCTPFIHSAISKAEINVEFLPYGNAKAWNKCQHGPPECKHNMLEACTMAHVPDAAAQNHSILTPRPSLDAICCLERALAHVDAQKAVNDCVHPRYHAAILKCFGTSRGWS